MFLVSFLFCQTFPVFSFSFVTILFALSERRPMQLMHGHYGRIFHTLLSTKIAKPRMIPLWIERHTYRDYSIIQNLCISNAFVPFSSSFFASFLFIILII